MDAAPWSRGQLVVGLLCAGAILVVRHLVLVGGADEGELATWLLAGSLPDRIVEALIFGVLASVLADRAPGPAAFAFNAVALAWVLAGLPVPDVGNLWPVPLVVGPVLAALVALAARTRPRAADSVPAVVVAALVALGLPGWWLGRAQAPMWEFEGQVVRPSRARPLAPSTALVVLDGVGAERADLRALPALATLARRGTHYTGAVAGHAERTAAVRGLLAGAPAAAREGLATGLFGPAGVGEADGFRVTGLGSDVPEAAVERAAVWLRSVAGARFHLVVVVRTDMPTEADRRDAKGDEHAAGLRAADRALGLLLSHLTALELDDSTTVGVVGSVEALEPEGLTQRRLAVPLLVAGPEVVAGRVEPATIPAADALALLRGEAPAQNQARFSGLAGARGVRRGDWVLRVDAQGVERLFQVEGDPSELVDLAAELPGRVTELRTLLGR